jgi:hypothetical protein
MMYSSLDQKPRLIPMPASALGMKQSPRERPHQPRVGPYWYNATVFSRLQVTSLRRSNASNVHFGEPVNRLPSFCYVVLIWGRNLPPASSSSVGSIGKCSPMSDTPHHCVGCHSWRDEPTPELTVETTSQGKYIRGRWLRQTNRNPSFRMIRTSICLQPELAEWSGCLH